MRAAGHSPRPRTAHDGSQGRAQSAGSWFLGDPSASAVKVCGGSVGRRSFGCRVVMQAATSQGHSEAIVACHDIKSMTGESAESSFVPRLSLLHAIGFRTKSSHYRLGVMPRAPEPFSDGQSLSQAG